MKQLHPIQIQILRKLLFAPGLRYTDLKPEPEMENNQFDFHLDQLVRSQYIEKQKSLYKLTVVGKEFAGRIDTFKNVIVKQAKIGCIVCPVRISRGKREYLVYTRLKQPFYGCQGFMSGKVLYGDTIAETARKELKEEANLEGGEAFLVKIKHFRVYDSKTNELVEDKIFFYWMIKSPEGEVVESEEGKYEWVPENLIFDYVTNHFESLDVFKKDVEMFNNFDGQVSFEETDHYTDKF